jgi:hypothetical protein
MCSVADLLFSVGNGRAKCGMVGGTVMLLAGTIAPLALNFTHHGFRWERLAALPGLFIGLTVLIASLNGVSNLMHQTQMRLLTRCPLGLLDDLDFR